MNNAMYKSMLDAADRGCNSIIKSKDEGLESMYFKALALVIVGRLRPFLRGKSAPDVYQITKEIKSLSKLRAADRHALTDRIIEYI